MFNFPIPSKEILLLTELKAVGAPIDDILDGIASKRAQAAVAATSFSCRARKYGRGQPSKFKMGPSGGISRGGEAACEPLV